MRSNSRGNLKKIGAALAVVTCLGAPHSASALTFNLTDGTGLTTLQGSNPALYNQVRGGFNTAAALWSNLFTDAVTVNINIDYAALSDGVIAQAGSTQANYTFTNVRAALLADATSADDLTATTNLPIGPAFNMLLNRTSNSPNGSGSATPYLDNDGDANNTTIRLNNANAKAIGLLAANNGASDATITFSNSFGFDFDRSNGIASNQLDFIGVAAHEIGHSLGFVSGVDILDINSPPLNGPFSDNQFTFVSALDLFRFSTISFAQGPRTIDWTANNTTKYFSINGGATSITTFSTGSNFGDGQQASHWKDNLGIGIMDPTAANGEFLTISNNDRRAFDVIGWNLNTGGAAAPEPGTFALLGLVVPFLISRRRQG